MPSKKLLGTGMTAGAVLAGLVVFVPAATSSAAPAPAAPVAPAAMPVAANAYLCAIAANNSVTSGGSTVAGNPFDKAVTASSGCAGRIAEIGELALDTKQTATIGTGTGGAGAGKITFNPVTFTVPMGTFANSLFQLEASGGHLKTVLISFRQPSAPGSFLTIKLNMAFVTSTELSYDGDALGGMKVGLDYGGLQFLYRQAEPNGALGTPNVSGWNRVTNTTDGNPNS
jgi:type VI protein secretion system component Hcp